MLGRIYVTKINVTKHIATLQNDNERLKEKIESLEKTVVNLREGYKTSYKLLKESIPEIVRSEIAQSDIQDQVLLNVVKAGLRIQENK